MNCTVRILHCLVILWFPKGGMCDIIGVCYSQSHGHIFLPCWPFLPPGRERDEVLQNYGADPRQFDGFVHELLSENDVDLAQMSGKIFKDSFQVSCHGTFCFCLCVLKIKKIGFVLLKSFDRAKGRKFPPHPTGTTKLTNSLRLESMPWTLPSAQCTRIPMFVCRSHPLWAILAPVLYFCLCLANFLCAGDKEILGNNLISIQSC